MRIPSTKRRRRLEVNMTPMIDVVFLLIIFFLVSSYLAKQEAHAELDLPVAQTGQENREADQRRLTINIAGTDAGYAVAFGTRVVDQNNLYQRLQGELERAKGVLEIRIRADRSVPYQIIEPILVGCADLNIWNVQFAVVGGAETSGEETGL